METTATDRERSMHRAGDPAHGARSPIDMIERYEAFYAPKSKSKSEPAERVEDKPVEPEPESKPRPKGRVIDQTRAARAAELYAQENATLVSVAAEMGVSPYTVRRDLQSLGIEVRSSRVSPDRQKKSADVDELIRELHGRGATPHDIADHIGVKVNAVRKRMHKLELVPDEKRTHGGAPELSLSNIAANALNEQAILADLLLQQDLDLIYLTEEQVKAWEATARRIGSGLAHVRRRLKKGANP